ncbi:hypothetical protein A2W57_02345 [Candidatus Giovannonibacteria bacterium RIFCSPHIGHO2_02_43_16]|uniref:Uncharacterized protein n=1 Tax=Candidatus Giovannonibacteria bacterium RIFCSPHIGHO2_02_43_16 TaxID=1798331 RepID=A0A1F5WFL1_9BACT|nr:MAG: hypothetical protein A2W57_02345 [Candidatus Giovannonibacteria bacterium RIFCSPHIGHO2_02_43_16]
MISSTTEKFELLFSKLPPHVQKSARRNLFMWMNNPSHPSLLFKKPFAGKPFWSIRITKGYRAIGYLKSDQMFWFWIGNHDDYERFLAKL